jgi:2-C-methyl-D-erythritol 4-phosphate cytidylyltransferase
MGHHTPKQFLKIGDHSILELTVKRFLETGLLKGIVLVLPAEHRYLWDEIADKNSPSGVVVSLVTGGNTRTASVRNGLQHIPDNALVAIHDGVRPLVPVDIITKSFEIAQNKDAAVAVVPLKDSIRYIIGEQHSKPADRSRYVAVQTPQTFKSSLIKSAYDQIGLEETFTDDAAVFEAAGNHIQMIEGSYSNLKITTPEDLLVAKKIYEDQISA